MSFSILDAIGKTPIVEILKLNPNPNVRLLAKLEYFNPGGSVKDRAALYMIEAAERSGELTGSSAKIRQPIFYLTSSITKQTGRPIIMERLKRSGGKPTAK
jgi:hypothetical protein